MGSGATRPEYRTAGAAGMDLCASEDVELAPLERKLVPTGLRVAIPCGFEGQVRPRSGLALRHGLGMVNAPGTIDSDYRGEIGLILVNWGTETVRLARGDRIAQLVIAPVAKADWVVGQSLDPTDRGEGGFGSTGA
ncbi:MAG: dUTP diphosphatase [Fimbriimonas ginsengisoli]|uniref:Deoxyuridine 5'-triphosphate nucleotidohydrolase n=1 Tax=Fimbriimonas ginsengisoli TaxID=1005039 RepID=A0A931LYW9_FIMGI|nr:dUTP diphosphatase [Fimbriimonas ginsengisoli]MBI3721882.1 dUTP diphosphatase [Fimbriimonas ginsengisoli]